MHDPVSDGGANMDILASAHYLWKSSRLHSIYHQCYPQNGSAYADLGQDVVRCADRYGYGAALLSETWRATQKSRLVGERCAQLFARWPPDMALQTAASCIA